MTTKRIVLTGGGSGGHIYPLLAVAEELINLAPKFQFSLELFYLGPSGNYDKTISQAGITPSFILASKWRRYASINNLLDIPKFFLSIPQAFFKMFLLMPDLVFSKGGTSSIPVVLAARFFRIPVIIHESDSIPGMNNLFAGKVAKKVYLGFPRAKQYFNPQKTEVVGNPIRRELLARKVSREEARQKLGIQQPDLPVILVIGSSQGSQNLNKIVLAALEFLLQKAHIIHQTGKANHERVAAIAERLLQGKSLPGTYRPSPYFNEEELGTALSAADLVISRASAGAINEIAAFGRAALLIPLPTAAHDHQRVNAYDFAEETKGAAVLEEGNLTPTLFLNKVNELLAKKEQLARWGMAASHFFHPEATERIAQGILETLSHSS
ncbi:UDP-N-acetylglucosamine--N-acetylmuramyl-(pentapeptide) pyrophosphoryl-undecaprenol N-acetylglucosamine transferase [Candidatus Parcubacteria bacterium]|nr:MAG: UDP-N-acetylglucosamine--N-acetylmuramyl-(pentapeptide) pyrophosphoryl-undecaprenol N-acetylglucosamine transferase [Candidatus Parcubacteria bacterium]